MKLLIKETRPRSIIQEIAKHLNVESRSDCLEEILKIPSEYGEGRMMGFNFKYGLGIILVDCCLKRDWVLEFETPTPSLLMKFNVKGEFWHAFDDNNIQYHLNPLQGTITANPKTSKQLFEFPAHIDLLFMAILIKRSDYLEKVDCMIDRMPDKLANVFSDQYGREPFFYQSNYSLSSSSCIQKIVTNQHQGLTRSTFVEGKTLELLSKQLRQFEDDLNSPSKKVTLRKFDLVKIKEARDNLIKDLKNPPTIEELAFKTGINRTKLKSGFKKVFDSTINEYLTNERLEKASVLLLNGLSIKEVSEQIGYSNSGHFAHKFKEKYGVLPKDYLKSIQIEIDSFELSNENNVR